MWKAPENLVVKTVLAVIVIILVPVALNKLVLKEVFLFFNIEENSGRALRGIMSGLVLSPLLYAWFYSRLYREKLAELHTGNIIRGIIRGVFLASLVLLPVILVFRLTGIITGMEFAQPEQFWYGVIMILVLAAT